MSYDIYIGECIVSDYVGEGELRATVAACAEKDAPTFVGDEMTRNENHRHPGYSQWSGWCEAVGLTSLFFGDEEGLMRRHPGTFALEKDHLVTVSDALTSWKQEHPDSVPGFGVGQDPCLARLVWLEYWMRRAIERCRLPAIHNR